jgi:hypothetical protein
MIQEFEPIVKGLLSHINEWEPRLTGLSNEVVTKRKNVQNRSIKQILGHMIDSASNNLHRVVHLQNLESPLIFPNYASNGNNDKWIAIQDYQNEDWNILIQLWKYSNLHYIHVMEGIKQEKLNNEWIAGPEKNISLKAMVMDYLRHFELHLNEIKTLIDLSYVN